MTSRSKKLLGDNVRRLRKANSWTMRQLAERMGISESTVSQWEAYKSWIDHETMDKLADVFQVPHSVLLAGDGSPYKPVNSRRPTLREALEVINESEALLTIRARSSKSKQDKIS